MTSGLIIMSTSGVVLFSLVLLFRVEDKRGGFVFLGSFRRWLDRVLLRVSAFLGRIFGFVGNRVLRVSVHYIVHSVLDVLISLLHRGQEKLAKWQHRNRLSVRTVEKEGDESTHLGRLSVFKKENTLTEAEKKKMKKH